MSDDDNLQRRGALSLLIVIVPILSVALVGVLFLIETWYGYQGRQAEGPPVRLAFSACAEAQPLLQARADEIGLEGKLTPVDGGFALDTRLPADPRIAAQIPETMAAPGVLEVHALNADQTPGELLASNKDVVDVTTYMDFLDTPKVAVKLNGEMSEALKMYQSTHIDGDIGLWLDGRLVTTRRNAPPEVHGELRLDLMRASDLDRIEFAAAAGVILQHGPLPCAVKALGTTPL